MPAKVKFYDKHGNLKTLDEIIKLGREGAVVMLSHMEYEVNQGNAFTFNTVDEALGDGGTLIVAFKTGHGIKVHFMAGFVTLVGGYLEIWEEPSWTTNTGTATAVINRSRRGTVASCSLLEDKTLTPAFTATRQVLVNPTGLNTGSATSLWRRYSWGEKNFGVGGVYKAENELMLKKNTTYAIVFTAIGASNKAQIVLNWIEHE